ncbi:MAG: hypothetical protein EA367_06365 [Leptolyngbya sp. DLM2.Bin15]|nr:MAG: hypothetical protein EA367_06365 [Leptolyngbya sp. DLM2.Bin15]
MLLGCMVSWGSSAIALPLEGGAEYTHASDASYYIAQQVVDGLPPPPPVAAPTPSAPTVSVPTTPRQAAPAQPSAPDNRYVVLINGDSPLLLDQVRRIDSAAALQTFQGQQMIQAGVFDNALVAQRQAESLAAQGIGAEVVAVPSAAVSPANTAPPETVAVSPPTQTVSVAPLRSPVGEPELLPATVTPREVEFGRPADPQTVAQAQTTAAVRGSSYYVVIPGRSSEVPSIADQVIRLGGGIGIASVVDERTSPLGPHVLVGPYVGRSAASRWSRYFRDFGMDARVYYRR